MASFSNTIICLEGIVKSIKIGQRLYFLKKPSPQYDTKWNETNEGTWMKKWQKKNLFTSLHLGVPLVSIGLQGHWGPSSYLPGPKAFFGIHHGAWEALPHHQQYSGDIQKFKSESSSFSFVFAMCQHNVLYNFSVWQFLSKSYSTNKWQKKKRPRKKKCWLS